MAATVITGASAGIGAATALHFARLGHELVLGARRMEKLREVAEACRRAGAREAHALPLDVRELASIIEFCKFANGRQPEVLLNNAGLARGRDPLIELRDEDLLEMIDTN